MEAAKRFDSFKLSEDQDFSDFGGSETKKTRHSTLQSPSTQHKQISTAQNTTKKSK